jgi:peptidoglycan hydrolase-like protein with peptidoglycan-binding domain
VNRHLTRRQAHPIGLLTLHRIRANSNLDRVSRFALWSLVTLAVSSGLPAALSQEPPSATTPPTSGSASNSRAIRPTLRLGSQGTEVSELQSLLKLLGYYTGSVDGQYQESTVNAVSAFQQAVQLQSDGVVGTETWNRLLPMAPPVQQTAAAASNVIPSGTTLAPATSPQASPQPAPRPNFPAPTAVTPAVTPAAIPTPAPAPSTPRPTQGYTPVTPAPNPAPSPAPAPAPKPQATTTAVSPAASPAASSADSTEPVLRRGMEGDAVTRLQQRLQAIGVFSGSVDGVFGAETELSVQEAQRNFSLEPDGVVGPATWDALRP